MRKPKYLSPSAIQKWRQNREEFYLGYLADHRPPRIPQTRPMSIGSAFDARIKSTIFERLFGNLGPEHDHRIDGGIQRGPEFHPRLLFEAQVEECNREWAWVHGDRVHREYVEAGALASLLIELENASEGPRFEFTIQNRVAMASNVRGVELLGKPDIWFVSRDQIHVLLDWKVNGYCAKRAVSPKKGYVRCVDCDEPWSKTHNKSHKDATLLEVGNITINTSFTLDEIDTSWATQLTIYGWIMGESIGGDFITGIEQICGSPTGTDFPDLRIASHRCQIDKEFQQSLFYDIEEIWNIVTSPDCASIIFNDDGLSPEASVARCKELDSVHKAFEAAPWMQSLVRSEQ
jgi:hypothetical protein